MKLFREYSETEEELEKEHDDFIEKQVKLAKLSAKEFDTKINDPNIIKKAKREWKIMKDRFNKYSFYTIKDQLEIYKKFEKIMFSTDSKNKETINFLGNLLFNHIKEFCNKERLIDEEIIKMIVESSMLDEDDKQEFDTEKKNIMSKNTKSNNDFRENRLLIQKKLYVLLLKIKHEVIGFKMRLGMIFYKYISEENSKHNLINKYLLYRIDEYVNENIEENSNED